MVLSFPDEAPISATERTASMAEICRAESLDFMSYPLVTTRSQLAVAARDRNGGKVKGIVAQVKDSWPTNNIP